MQVELDSHMSTAYALASWSQRLSAGQPQYDKQSPEAWQRDEARRVQVELDNNLSTAYTHASWPQISSARCGKQSSEAWRVQVELDNHLSTAYTKVELSCADRKGLLFDLMRTLKDINIRVAYGAH